MRALALWDAFWFSSFDPVAARRFRVALGLTALTTLLLLYPDWERYYGRTGVTSLADPEFLASADVYARYWTVLRLDAFLATRLFWWLGALAAAGLAAGRRPRVCAAALYVLFSSMVNTNPLVVSGEEALLRLLLFCACFVDFQSARPAAWPLRLVQVYVALIYAIAFLGKVGFGGDWLEGEALYWLLASPRLSRWPWPHALLTEGPWIALATYGTLLLEAALPFLLWVRRAAPAAVAAAALFHVAGALLFKGPSLLELTMLCPLLLFLPGRAAAKP